MSFIEIPKVKLIKSGIPERFHGCSLRHLKGKAGWQGVLHKNLTKYTRNLTLAMQSGTGLFIFGADDTIRQNVVFGLLKAVVAQNFSVQVAEIDEIVQWSLAKNDEFDRVERSDVCCILEMDVSSTLVNRMHQSKVMQVLQKRVRNRKPTICVSQLPLFAKDECVDFLFPDTGRILKKSTILVSLDPEFDSDWTRAGHDITFKNLN